MSRASHIFRLASPAAVVLSLGLTGCGSENEPATSGTGAATSTGGASSGGTSSGGSGATSGGATSGGATSGGATTGGSNAGGAAPAAGATSDAGAPSTGGSATGGSGGSAEFQPACTGNTAAGVPVAKGGVCVETDPQMCWKTCGPQSIGWKSETCTAGFYVEMSGCSFPADRDYSCYSIPETLDPSCPAEAPQAKQPCNVPECTPCTDASGTYFDSSGNAKIGYCVCPPNADPAARTWSCASTTAWPCPAGQGCL